jgi:hypothetical protein
MVIFSLKKACSQALANAGSCMALRKAYMKRKDGKKNE